MQQKPIENTVIIYSSARKQGNTSYKLMIIKSNMEEISSVLMITLFQLIATINSIKMMTFMPFLKLY